MRNTLLSLFILLTISASAADRYVKREVRGVWVATVFNIDWPSTTGTSMAIRNKQKKEMQGYLDILQKNNFNAVYFQVRSMCDAMYKSSYEPWSSYLTGTRGRTPGWDPLEFMVEECHKRGLECHAWVNPYRWSTSAASKGGWTTSRDLALKDAGMLITYDNGSTTYTILNPALPATNQRIVDVCQELIENYDIDGIIFDDYFYPSGMPATSAAEDYADYKASKTSLSFGDWRRANVNGMVADVYHMIQQVDPACKFGISPAGAACTDAAVAAKHGVDRMPVASDWQYNGIFSDPVAWLQEGTIDYISPQIYWKTDHSTNPFGPMTQWWSRIAKKFGRHHYASHSLTFLQSSGNTTTDWKEVGQQLQYSRQYTLNAAPGAIYYSACDIDGYKVSGLGEWLKVNKYQHPALTPAITWKEAPELSPVSNLRWEENTLSWDTLGHVHCAIYAIPATTTDERAESSTAGGILSNYLQRISWDTTFQIPDSYLSDYRFAVTAIDRYGNESAPVYVLEEGTGIIDMASQQLEIEVEAWELQLSQQADVQLYSLTGTLMASQQQCTEFSLSGLPSGIYIVKATNRSGTTTKKIQIR